MDHILFLYMMMSYENKYLQMLYFLSFYLMFLHPLLHYLFQYLLFFLILAILKILLYLLNYMLYPNFLNFHIPFLIVQYQNAKLFHIVQVHFQLIAFFPLLLVFLCNLPFLLSYFEVRFFPILYMKNLVSYLLC